MSWTSVCAPARCSNHGATGRLASEVIYQVRICLQKIMYGLKDSHLATQTIKIYMYQLVSLVTANYVMIIYARSNSIPQENTGVKEKPTYIYFLKLSSLKHVQLYFNKTKQNKTKQNHNVFFRGSNFLRRLFEQFNCSPSGRELLKRRL